MTENRNSIHFVLAPEIEEELRNRAKKKGDLSKIANQALQAYFSRLKLKEAAQDA